MKRFTLAETLRLMAEECRQGQRTGKSDRWALTLDDAANTLDRLQLERDSAREQFDKHVEWASSASEGWQDSESAPKDGTEIIAWTGQAMCFSCYDTERHAWIDLDDPSERLIRFDFWMPVPAPPDK